MLIGYPLRRGVRRRGRRDSVLGAAAGVTAPAGARPKRSSCLRLLVGYARVSTQDQDLTAQRDSLAALGVPVARTYDDHGLTGADRDRSGLREALAACRNEDTLVVTKLDRLARSLPDARDILEDLTTREVKLSIGGSVHDPTDPRTAEPCRRSLNGEGSRPECAPQTIHFIITTVHRDEHPLGAVSPLDPRRRTTAVAEQITERVSGGLFVPLS